jgi:predicted nucleic acid-binding protein
VIVLDSSAAVDYLLVRSLGEWVEGQIEHAERVHAPHLLDVEVLGAIRQRVRLGEVSRRRGEEAIAALQDLRVRRYGHVPFLTRMWELRQNLTAGDAVFVALAEALRMPLITTDYALAGAPGPRIQIITP